MNEDLISDKFADNINRTIVKRNFVISKLLLVLCMLWSVMMLINWYRILKGGNAEMIQGPAMVYDYIILPISDVIVFGLSVYAYFLIVKAYRFFESSLDQSDGNLMSEGFRYFYTSNLLTVFSFIISIITMIVNFLL